MMDRSLLEKKILIVEDEKLMRNLLLQMLKRMGFSNVNAIDNAEEVVKTYNYWKTDLLISDIEMDGMSGLDLIEAIRNKQTPLSTEVSIIVLTGLSKLQILMKAAELKIQGFLTKPVTEELLRNRIEEVLSKSHQIEYRDPKLNITVNDSSNNEDLDSVDMEDQKENHKNNKKAELINVIVDLDKLSVGMVLKEDVVARGHTILRAGKVIQEGHLKVLNDLRAFIGKKEFMVNMVK